jgi:uncharacterized cysteine cluster protein YcgN (CxxCxxCC family)
LSGHPKSLCRKCGRCCYAKLRIEDELVYTTVPCPHLDEKTRLCRVYERRFETNPGCLPVEEGIRLGVFPADCPHVADVEGYKPPVLDWRKSKHADLIARAFDGTDDEEA